MRQTIVKAILVAAAALSAGAAGAAMFANVYVEPGHEVLLGEDEPGPFNVRGKNIGQVAIEVAARSATGHDSRLAVLEPGARLDQDFAAGESAVLSNAATDRDAVLMLRVHADNAGAVAQAAPGKP